MLLFTTSCRRESAPATVEESSSVMMAPVVRSSLSKPVHTVGIIVTEEETRLSFKTGGLISSVAYNEGSRVRKGDILASLDLSEIRANYEMAEINFNKALRDHERASNLYADSVITLEMFQNAASALEAARSSLSIGKFNLAHSVIKAPADGLILKQLVRENELVQAGYPVILFGTASSVWKVKAGLPDRDVVRTVPGDSASVTTGAWPGKVFAASVEQLSSLANPSTGTFEATLLLDPGNYRLAAGFIAGVEIFPSETEEVTIVPVGSLAGAENDSGYVFSVGNDHIAMRHKVRIISVIGSDMAISGLPDEITEVVSEGAAWLRDGIKVEEKSQKTEAGRPEQEAQKSS